MEIALALSNLKTNRVKKRVIKCWRKDLKKILFVSGSLGLGHISRDLEIVRNLRKSRSDIEVSWLADDPATALLEQAGELILPESKMLDHGNKKLGVDAKDHGINLTRWVMNMRKAWAKNAKIIFQLIQSKNYDLVIGDETYDLIIELLRNPKLKEFPFIVIYDFLGLDSVSNNPLDLFITYRTNKMWSNYITHKPPLYDKSIFIGEIEDVQDKKFGIMLPNRREIAEKYFDFVGYIINFNPQEYQDKKAIRETLGYGNEKLVVCSIGGTSAGKALLRLCEAAFPLIKKEIPDIRLILVLGPQVPFDFVKPKEGVTIVGYLPELYKHLAAADLSIVTGGGTITLELTALQKPFLYFPLEKHFEQEVFVAQRCERHKAGVKMKFSETNPENLTREVVNNINKKVQYSPIPIDGAKKAANIIAQFL